MRVLRWILVLGSVVWIGSLPAADQSPRKETVKIARKWQVQNSGAAEKKKEVFRAAAAWEVAWKQAHSRIFPPPKVPELDFEKSMVVAYYLGAKRTGGYNVEISKVEKVGNVLTVFVLETVPEGVTTKVRTSPCCFAVIPKVDVSDVTFQVTQKPR